MTMTGSEVMVKNSDINILKRVAMVIAKQRQSENWEGFIEDARAIVEVMLESTHSMYMHGGNAEPYNRAFTGRMKGRRIGDLPARDAWRMMIECALLEFREFPDIKYLASRYRHKYED